MPLSMPQTSHFCTAEVLTVQFIVSPVCLPSAENFWAVKWERQKSQADFSEKRYNEQTIRYGFDYVAFYQAMQKNLN